jgi:cytochrome b561
MIGNTQYAYGWVAKSFHWIIALLLVGMFPLAYIMTSLGKSDFKFSLYDLHKATGLLIFCLVALRLSWRLVNVQPKLPPSVPTWQRRLSDATVATLYVCMFAMPMSGFLMSTLGGHDVSFYGLFQIPALAHDKSASGFFSNAHELISYLLIAAFSLHVIGALYHYYFLKDGVLNRMLIERK